MTFGCLGGCFLLRLFLRLELLKLYFLLLFGYFFSSLLAVFRDPLRRILLSSLFTRRSTFRLFLLATLLFLVFLFAFLSLQNLSEDSLSHHLIYFALKCGCLTRFYFGANFAFGGGGFNNKAEFFVLIFAVFQAVLLPLLPLGVLVLSSLLEKSFNLDSNGAPCTRSTIDLLKFGQE